MLQSHIRHTINRLKTYSGMRGREEIYLCLWIRKYAQLCEIWTPTHNTNTLCVSERRSKWNWICLLLVTGNSNHKYNRYRTIILYLYLRCIVKFMHNAQAKFIFVNSTDNAIIGGYTLSIRNIYIYIENMRIPSRNAGLNEQTKNEAATEKK